jgi:hypothetical protein
MIRLCFILTAVTNQVVIELLVTCIVLVLMEAVSVFALILTINKMVTFETNLPKKK